MLQSWFSEISEHACVCLDIIFMLDFLCVI